MAIAREATAANMAAAQNQMDFQERMSNTAYQRARADMEKAGINPMLMTQQGGASSPAGASGSAVSAHVENAVIPALTAAKDVLATTAAVNKAFSEADEADSRAALNRISLGKVAAETKVAAGTARKVGFEGEIVRSQMQAARNREWRSKQVDKVQQRLGPVVERFTDDMTSAAKAATDGHWGSDLHDWKEENFGDQPYGLAPNQRLH